MYIYDKSHNIWAHVTGKANKRHNTVEQSVPTMCHSMDTCYGIDSEMYIYDKKS